MVESIKEENKFDEIEIYYYNPNIHPRSEYQSRLKAMKLMIGDLKMVVADWMPKEYFETLRPASGRGTSLDREALKKGVRCEKCWRLRLEKTAEYAKKNGFEAFSSTLLTSEYQKTDTIEKIGKKVGKKLNIEFLIPKNVCKHLKTKGFYKQVFCGCCYSLVERFEEKFK
jgi:predicted adenine nucleotide alpha hydrolase (AANH) superfamily ATPase